MTQLHLIPAPLYEAELQQIPTSLMSVAVSISHYFVENVRTARRVLKMYDKSVVIDNIQFVLLDDEHAVATLNRWHKEGVRIGIMSEAGLPAIADPGDVIVSAAHKLGITVVPHSGPSSIILSLIASGFNGQHFTFLGYLPIQAKERNEAIKKAEEQALKHNTTQIFIETPYRNNQMLEALCTQLQGNTGLCIAANITSQQSNIRTMSIKDWRQRKLDYHKQPVIFLIGKMKG